MNDGLKINKLPPRHGALSGVFREVRRTSCQSGGVDSDSPRSRFSQIARRAPLFEVEAAGDLAVCPPGAAKTGRARGARRATEAAKLQAGPIGNVK